MKPRKSENWLKNGEKTAKFGPESFKMSEKMKTADGLTVTGCFI